MHIYKNFLKVLPFLVMLSCLTLFSCQGQNKNEKPVHSLEWTEGPTPEYKYRYHISVSYDDKIFVVGGDNDGAFEYYNPSTDTWTSLPNLPTPRLFIGGTTHKDKLYVIGGMDNDSFLYSNQVEKYDFSTRSWISCQSLTTSRSRLAVVSLQEKIYAIGGLEGKNDQEYKNSSALEVYDPVSDTWTRKTDMPTPRHGHSATVINEKIYVVGGYTENGPSGIVEVYDPNTNRWTQKADMPTPRGFFGLISNGPFAYAIAGRVRQEVGPVERYNTATDQWTQLTPVPFWRNRFGITRCQDKIYIIGGENNPGSMLIGAFLSEENKD